MAANKKQLHKIPIRFTQSSHRKIVCQAVATFSTNHPVVFRSVVPQKEFQTIESMRHSKVMQWLRVLLFVTLAASTTAWAQLDQFQFRNPTRALAAKKHTRARLVLSHEAARPGETIMAGVELMMDQGWHTYWRNPGESGQATEIHWNLPDGLSAGEIQWPVPEKFISPDQLKLTTFVFHDRAVLLVPLKIADSAATGERDLSALVKWLECEVACIPGSNTVRGTLLVTNESRLNSDTNFFAEAQQRLPSKTLPGSAAAKWDAPGDLTNRAFLVEWATSATNPDFFPYTNALATVSPKTVVATTSANQALLRKSAERMGADWPKEITGLLVRKEGERLAGYEVTLPLAKSATSVAGASSSKSIWVWLLYAFIGGLILNIMPCVLPVIALKILGFVNQSRETPGRVKTLGLLYTLGVIVSFLVLAGVVIGVKAAGQKAGWGLQFSNPYFIVVLTVIVTLVALNLFGVFEITLSGGAMSAAGAASSRQGNAGAFMNGVLATVLATPCTAPFLGASLGFAFAQPAHMIVLFFVVIALGLASPYLLLSWNPRWLKFLPKPGAWMERFKIAMGFPMLATALWLLNLTTTFYGDRSWWLGVFLVFVGAAAWLFGTFVQRGGARRVLALLVTLGLLGGGYAWALEAELRWRSPGTGETTSGLALAPKGYPWRAWSPESLAEARASGRPVIVDFTAKWCQTCNTIVKPALGSEAVRAKLKAVDAIALLADYTAFPPVISAELEKHERAGVPLVLVYPKDASKPPMVLSEALTSGEVVEALERAAK
jgi:thiol:disulfide interchange protein